jgi:ubiquinone/menaquinone biosynthesis C-methylase UbiE
MRDIPSQQELDAAVAYDKLFVPALFGEWAPRVADAAQVKPGDRALDVACGTGVLARSLFTRAGTSGAVDGLDPNAGMLAVAALSAPAISWQQGLAEALPYADQSFDVIASQFGLMFFGDRARAIHEMVRVLAPGGHLAVAVWGPIETSPGYRDEVSLLERTAGKAAADAVRAPFVMGDRQALAAMFTDVGVASLRVTTQQGTARFPGVRTMVEADLRGWLPVMGVVLTEKQIGGVLGEAEAALGPYVDDWRGRVPGSGHIVTGTRP